MLTPEYLKKGDKIGIVSPARKISNEEIRSCIRILESWGLEVVPGKSLYRSNNQFAGTDTERVEDLQVMLDDVSIKAVLCSRGGYGTARIIDDIDFTNFLTDPKWIIGFSDITVLHSHINTNYKIETLHAMMAINFANDRESEKARESLRSALFGESISYDFPFNGLNRAGESEGSLTGGNLSILYSLRGTDSDINTTGKILFLEDLDEYLYHIDRMVTNLKRSGMLDNLAGLIVGGMNDMNDNDTPFGKTAEEIISDTVSGRDYPVCFGFPAGHIKDNRALIFGRKVRLMVSDGGCQLRFDP